MKQKTIFVLGGARSGKSRHAMAVAEEMSADPVLIATAVAVDEEMEQRIAHHRRERGPCWTTVEEPLDLAGAIAKQASGETVVVDCLTMWLSNLMHEGRECAGNVDKLLEAIRETPADLVLVSNEVGLGIVPDTPLGRRFRDEQGRLNQSIAKTADQVILLTAGLPLLLKN